MIRWAIPLVLLAGCSQPTRTGGIVSTNPCADAILVRLVAPERIGAISHYSHDAGATSLPLAVALRFPVTGGTAEEVIALKPELVLTSSFTPAATRAAYAKAGLRVLVLGSPVTVAESVAQVREVATAVGARARGEAMVGAIKASLVDEAIANSTRHPGLEPGSIGQQTTSFAIPADARVAPWTPARGRGDDGRRAGQAQRGEAALFFIAGDLANGSGTLLDELMRRAGFRNAAADYGLEYTGMLPVETLAAQPPDVIISTGEGRTAALRRRVLPHTREATFDRRLVNCGGPSIPAALARLRAIRASL